MSVFISYSTKDSDFVKKLSATLVKNRINVWLDKWEMKPGDSLIDKIQNAVTDSSFLLIVLSNNSVESEWCKKELNAGLMRELNEKQVVVIPILIEDCKIPAFLQEKVYADFRKDFDEGFKSLIRPLAKLYSENMGRSKTNGVITDYAVNYGLYNERFFMAIDLVNWYEKEKKSILLQVQVNGCENATKRFLLQVESGMPWLMKETLISTMSSSKEFRELNILVQSDSVYHYNLGIRDPKAELTYQVHFRAVLMGEDTANDVLLNFVDFLELLEATRRERMSDVLLRQ